MAWHGSRGVAAAPRPDIRLLPTVPHPGRPGQAQLRESHLDIGGRVAQVDERDGDALAVREVLRQTSVVSSGWTVAWSTSHADAVSSTPWIARPCRDPDILS
jgi:hypothetical protein